MRLKSLYHGKFKIYSPIAFLAIFLSSVYFYQCTYSFSGLFPSRLRNAYIPIFKNETDRYGLEEVTTQVFVDAIREDGRLRITSESRAAMRVDGTLKSYKREPYEYDETGKVISYKVTITAELGFYDIQNDEYYLGPSTFRGWSTYDPDKETEDDGIKKAIQDLVDNSLRALFLKGF